MMTARREEMSRHWPVAFAAFFGIVLGAWAVPIYTLGPLSTPLIAEFGWPPSTLFASVSALSLGLAIGSPVVGELADRHSARAVALGSMLALAACVALLGCMTGAPWQLHLLFFLMGLLGSGTGGIIYTRAIGDRFQAARGLALGLALSGTGVASFAAPLFVDQVVHIAGWRAVGPTFAGLMILVAMPILAWGLRPSSEGNRAPQPENGGEAVAAISRKEALRDLRFYLLLAPMALFGLFVSSLIINITPALIDRGISTSKAAQIASILGIATILGRITIGWMIDRWPATLIGAASFAIGAVGLVWFAQGESTIAVFAVFALGFLIGAEIDLMSFLVLRFFGVVSFGSIFGLMFSLFSVASICGPLLCAGLVLVFGLTGFYWAAAAAFAIAAGILVLLHQRRDEGATAHLEIG